MSEMLSVASADSSEYQPMSSAPQGAKCILMTRGGVAVIGVVPLNAAAGYDAWAPLPKRPTWLKELQGGKI